MPRNWSHNPPLTVIAHTLRRAVTAVGFWGAITLPVAVIVLITVGRSDLLGPLLVCNGLCVLLGHHHEPTREGWLPRVGERATMEVGQ